MSQEVKCYDTGHGVQCVEVAAADAKDGDLPEVAGGRCHRRPGL
jgi:hypothetical protein